jgi:PAS domain S-box-containing protein
MKAFKNISKVTAVIAILFGCCVIIGWIFNITILKSVLNGLVAVKSNTAVAFILIGISLFCCKNNINPSAKYITQICALLVAVIGLLSLSEYFFGWDLGIDQIFFKEPVTAINTSDPGRMAPTTAFNFFMIGVSLLLLYTRIHILISQLIGILVLMIGFLNFIGYVYGVEAFYGIASYTRMALSTAIAFIIVGIGIFFIKNDRGLTTTLSGDNIGSKMARRLILFIFLFIPLIGWLRITGQHIGLYESEFGTATRVCIDIIVLIIIIWINANWINRIEIKRKYAEEIRVQLASIIENSDDAIIGKTLDGIIMSWNTGAELIYGYTAQEIKGKNVSILTHPEYPEEIPGILGKIKRGEHIDHYETARVTKDFKKIFVSLTVSPIKNESGEITGISTIARDITEHKQMQEKLLIAERLATIGQFSGNIAHEIRNPLATIDSSVFYLKEKLKNTEEKVKEHLNRIKSSTDSASAIIQSVLNLTRMKEPQLETDDLIKIITEVIISLKLPDTIEVIQNFYEEQILINADREQIHIAFKNIIKNAIEAMDHKGTLTITACEKQNNKIEIFFTDTGTGIAAEDINKIFEPLFTTKAKGIGFGLSMSKMIVEKHQGTIEVKTEPGKGTTIIVKLPLKL